MQGAQIRRNEAYVRYAAVTEDVAQRRRWTFYKAVKSKPLAFLLMLGLANLGFYLPAADISPCSCMEYQSCQMDHTCPHCTAKKELPKKTSGDMCHSGKEKPQAAEHQDTARAVKIFNPACGAGASLSFTPQPRDPFVVSEYFVCIQDLDISFFSFISLLPPEEVDLTLPDKPPRLITLLS